MANKTVTARIVSDENERMKFLPKHFFNKMIVVENVIYDFMGALSPDYGGGFWEFYELSNGGAFIVPSGNDQYKMISPNGYEATLSAERAGIVACLFAFSNLSFRHNEIGKYYHLLHDYAISLPEPEPIINLID